MDAMGSKHFTPDTSSREPPKNESSPLILPINPIFIIDPLEPRPKLERKITPPKKTLRITTSLPISMPSPTDQSRETSSSPCSEESSPRINRFSDRRKKHPNLDLSKIGKKKSSSHLPSSRSPSNIIYSFREGGSNSPSEMCTRAKQRSYLPNVELFNETLIDQWDKSTDWSLNRNLYKELKIALTQCSTPPLAIEALSDHVKEICKLENEHWFNLKRKELTDARCFQIMHVPREKLLLELVLNSGILIIHLLKRLHCLKKTAFEFMQKHSKKTKWSLEFYDTLKKLTTASNFNNNKWGLTEGIVLQDFLMLFSQSKKDVNIEKILNRAVNPNSHVRIDVIAFFAGFANPTDELKEVFSNKIKEFDEIMTYKGMVPHFRHICIENKDAKHAMGSIKFKDITRSIKEDGHILLNSIHINNEKFYDHTLLPKIGNQYLDALHLTNNKDHSLLYVQIAMGLIENLQKEAKDDLFYRKLLLSLMLYVFGPEVSINEDNLDIVVTKLLDTFNTATALLGKNEELCRNICYLLGIKNWIKKNKGFFLSFFTPSSNIIQILGALCSQKQVYIELYSAHYQAVGKTITRDDISHEVDFLLDEANADQLVTNNKKYPLLRILQLYTVNCWGFAETVFRTLYPQFYSELATYTDEGTDSACTLVNLMHFEVSLTRTFSLFRKAQKNREELVKLAEIPLKWTVGPHKNTWKATPEILNHYTITSEATREETLKILKQIINFNQENETNFSIESSLVNNPFHFHSESDSDDQNTINHNDLYL